MSVTLGTFLGSVVGKKVIDKILDAVEKRIPMTKEQKTQLEVELAKTEVEIEKVEVEKINAKSKFIQSLTNAMPLIQWILPTSLGLLILCFFFQFASDVVYSIRGLESRIYNIDGRWVRLMEVFIEYLFYGKIAGKLSPFHKSDMEEYGNKLLNKIYK